MSVVRSKRTLSKSEYAMFFTKVYKKICEHLSRVPKRKQRYLCEPISCIANELHRMIMMLFDRYYKYEIKEKNKYEQAETVIYKIHSLQKPLLALWNIERTETDRMINLVEMLNKEIEYIAGYGDIPIENLSYMYILDYKAINKMEFIKTMSKLHRMIYQKMLHLPANNRNMNGTLLMRLADDALYHVCEANRNYPTCKEIYNKRIEHLSIALSEIKSMQVPIFSVFNLAYYSNNTMLEISALLDTEIRLLKGLIESDKKRFANLK